MSYLQNMHPDTAVAPLKKQKENNSQNKISTDSQEWDIKNVQRPIINKNSKITKFLLDSHMQVVCVWERKQVWKYRKSSTPICNKGLSTGVLLQHPICIKQFS